MIRTLFFDLGNVIVSVNKKLAIQNIAQLPGMSLDLVHKIAGSRLEIDFEKGLISINDYFTALHKEYNLPCQITVDTLIDIWQDPFEPIPEVCELIPILKKQVKLILLSNTNDLHIRAVRKKTGILDEFDDLVLSYKVNSRKPEEAIYRTALSVSGHRPEECLFVDDLIENVEAARRIGIRSHQFTSIRGLYSFLKQAGIHLN